MSTAPPRLSIGTRTYSIWLSQLLLSMAVVVIVLLVQALAPETLNLWTFTIGVSLVVVLTALALALPWQRLPRWAVLVIPLLDIVAVGLMTRDTPIDFAFHVHTEVGLRCQGAKINGRIAPLHRELRSGDTVEILTSPSAKPSRDWLSHVRTARARHKIKQWINHEEEKVSVTLGKEILAREVRRRRLDPPDDARLARAAQVLSLADGRGLEIAVGRGDVAIGQVIRALYPDLPSDELQEPKPTVFGRVIDRIRLGRGIKIQGVDGLLVRYAQCCQPVPGDSVVGYVTQGRGISIHRSSASFQHWSTRSWVSPP